MTPVALTAQLLEAFSGTFLSPLYDVPKPTPPFHRQAWDLYCSDVQCAAIAAPRGHAKSTALTHDYGLGMALFRQQDYIILLGASEEMAVEHLGDIASELLENDDLIEHFGIKRFITQQKTDIIVEMDDGHQFRFLARGAEQKIRGRKWRGKRPGLIIGDDMEDDEQVENRDRRKKFRNWFLRAAKQALRDGGKIRVHGTILHEDSMLANLMRNPGWHSHLYKAHESFDDFSNILWPEQFSEAKLRRIRQEFMDNGDAAGYSQEYLNDPLDNSDAFLRKEDFIPQNEEERERSKVVYAAADFAVSKADIANRTSFTVGGMCTHNLLHFLDQYVGRWDSAEWIEILFQVHATWQPEIFWVEDGVIWKSVAPMIYAEMRRRNIYINFEPRTPVKDKATRGRSLQRRMRARATRWNTESPWYTGMEYELLRFTGSSQSMLDDQFDSAALLSLGLDKAVDVEDDDFLPDDEFEIRRRGPAAKDGRSRVTGY